MIGVDASQLQKLQLRRFLNEHVEEDVDPRLQSRVLLQQLLVGPLQVHVVLQDGVVAAAAANGPCCM